MSTDLFRLLVVIGIFASATSVLWTLRDITKLLAAILDEMTGAAQRMRDEARFYDRPNGGKE